MPTPVLASQPPTIRLQPYSCEHRTGPDELRSKLIRRDQFLDPNNAHTYFELVQYRLQPGEFVVLRLGGANLRLVRHPHTPRD